MNNLDVLAVVDSAWRNGEYTLPEDEGFYCDQCEWRGLSAPMADDADRNVEEGVLCHCPECGDLGPELRGSVDYDRARSEIPDDYLDQ